MRRNADLAAFLSSRRARLQPSDVGLVDGGGRRVPGLRREEIALIAGVSVDYYARLEQGRDLQPSDQVLDAVARALRLDRVEQRHLHRLVRGGAHPSVRTAPAAGPLRRGTRLLLDGMDGPAMVLDVRGDVRAINRLGRLLFTGLGGEGSSHTRWVFLDPAARELLSDWDGVARATVLALREAIGRHPDDRTLRGLAAELGAASPEFAAWWAEHDVAPRCHAVKRFRHPVVGELELQSETLQLDGEELWLFGFLPEPGSASAHALRLLDSWSDADANGPQPVPVLKP